MHGKGTKNEGNEKKGKKEKVLYYYMEVLALGQSFSHIFLIPYTHTYSQVGLESGTLFVPWPPLFNNENTPKSLRKDILIVKDGK